MIWIILIIGLFCLSLGLAYRSMSDFQELPSRKLEYGLFLIRNSSALNQAFFEDLQSKIAKKSLTIAFEKVFKGAPGGTYKALLMYCPRSITADFNQLNLLELEDYTNRLLLTDLTASEVIGKPKQGKQITVDQPFLNMIQLTGEDELFFQIVCRFLPNNSGLNAQLAATIRVLVKAETAAKRTEIARDMNFRLAHSTNLTKRIFARTSVQLFDHYRKRSFYPEESTKLSITPSQILTILSD